MDAALRQVTAGPSRASALAVVGLGVVLAVAAAMSDPAGRLLAGPAAAVALVLGVRDLLLRPVLDADADGVTVVQGLRRRRAPWSAVSALRVVTERRTPLLELDLGSDVVLLSRGRLGRSPGQVREELEELRGPR